VDEPFSRAENSTAIISSDFKRDGARFRAILHFNVGKRALSPSQLLVCYT
jgi:hypothetical protein